MLLPNLENKVHYLPGLYDTALEISTLEEQR